MSNIKNKTWIPPTDEEIEDIITKQCVKPPRPLSLVKFASNSMFRKTYLVDSKGQPNIEFERDNYSSLLYLGDIPNQSGHGAYINLTTNKIYIIDIDELVELTKEEL